MLPHLVCALSGLTFLTSNVNAALYQDPSSLPTDIKFDYVIVGGGVAGSVLANRLTEKASVKVLVLEAGPSNAGSPPLIIPGLSGTVTPGSQWDWNYTTVNQPSIGNRTFPYQIGHVLGGGSSVNSMIYTRASAGDYDRLASVTKESSWSWNNMLPYFLKSEVFGPPADGHDIRGQYNPTFHGKKGLVGVSLAGQSYSVDGLVKQATSELSSEFPFIEDYNTGKPLGFGWTQSTIKNGSRSSAATAYLADNFLQRPNLHVVVNAYVSRVLSSTTLKGKIDAVAFGPRGNTSAIHVRASKEVILSAGSLNTPHILLNSGIGDASALRALNIPVIRDLPGVGRNLSDHPVLLGSWNRNANDTLERWNAAVSTSGAAEALDQWTASRKGPYADGWTNQVAFLRLDKSLPDVKSIFDRYGDPAPGPSSPHMQLLPYNAGPFSMAMIILTPYSRGSVKLNPANPSGPPLLDVGFYSSQGDLLLMRQAFNKMLRFISAPVWKTNLGAPLGLLADVLASDKGKGFDLNILDNYIRAATLTISHASGTAAMSPRGADWGVVDPDLRVKGVSGLRIVDGSIFPFIPTANTQAPTYAIAERAADVIKNSN